MLPGLDELRVPLKWTSPEGVMVVKTYVFRRGSYQIDVEYEVTNASGSPWSVAPYSQILHDMPPVERSYFNVDSYAFTGPALWDGTKYDKLDTDDSDDASLNRDITGGWLASLQHHFVAAIAPSVTETDRYTLKARGQEYLATVVGPTRTVAAGETGQISGTVFVGPKLQTQLEAIHPELGRAADYGMLTFLAKPLFWLLRVGAQHLQQLGTGDHRRHLPAEAGVLSAVRGQRQVDGEDEDARAAHEADAGDVQGRSREARPRDDGAVQEGEGQPGLRLPADADPAAGVPGLLLGAARERGDAPGAVLRLDPGPLRRAIRSSSCR